MIKQSQARAIVIWEDLFNSRINCDIVFLGSSRTCYSYNPKIIDSIAHVNSYNLGLHGKMADMDVVRYKLLTKYNKKPKYVVWDFYHNSFSESNGWLDEQFTPYLFDDDLWEELIKPNHGFKPIDRYIPMYRYWRRPFIYSYAFHDFRHDMNPYKGFLPSDDKGDFSKMNNLGEKSVTCRADNSIINDVSSSIKRMKSDGINVILVISPFYSGGINRLDSLDMFINVCEQLSIENNCVFLNYLEDPMCSDSTLFVDCMHLNSRGADIFSIKLATTLDSLLHNTEKVEKKPF